MNESPLSGWAASQVEAGGWIRRMFAEGQRLRTEHGDDSVIDLSLGQPLDAPAPVRDALARAGSEFFPGRHAYMPNLGYPELRERAAEDVGAPGVTAACIAMTGGAAGAVCLALRAFLDVGDEVVGIAPYFPEFRPYCETGGLSFTPVRADDTSQRVDIDALVHALTDRTAAVIINSPSNPSGHVIEHEEMAAIVDVLEHHNRRTGRRILLIADEAYRNLVYAPARRVEPFAYYEHTVLARSFSKDMGLAGERIGYLVLHPSLAGEQTDRGLEGCMRALGMVNAPATAQRALLYLDSWNIGVEQYHRLRDHGRDAAVAAGLDVAEPQGGIFLWIRSPWPDTLAYVSALAERRVLVTPGIAFEVPARFRLCFTSTPERLSQALATAGEVAGSAPG
ncbi:MAG: aminotransferase class I/II-fold pyridoxal phosphate-dependent enzyme [Candidatus Dormibacteraeota bacterium]|uniref:Aminotransferase n=1 Tax=Candidatus Aeolococcus gillhamiae TaxID=3127015 RepID=A0A2W5ZBE0_9BACT|nr:aminotransferase class I/II-fold pyridoxal phosphate-dependent enzyme [Candidatus Dormibacteraeota bacterium]PZR81327.1 MAG: pyridoxal phosphate-dependent aminotransferase [Candidatus Dormibacter sp. RRmetagenome_bin12]